MDIKLLRQLAKYNEVNGTIAKVAIGKLVSHLYYLTEECVPFALFDDSIIEDTKVKMRKIV